MGSASYIHICGRSSVRLAYQTHYVGDLRAINNQLVDTYQLKSLDGFFGGLNCCYYILNSKSAPFHYLEFDFDFDRDNASTIKLVEKNGKFLFILPDYNVRKPEHLDCKPNDDIVLIITYSILILYNPVIDSRDPVYGRVILCTGFKVRHIYTTCSTCTYRNSSLLETAVNF